MAFIINHKNKQWLLCGIYLVHFDEEITIFVEWFTEINLAALTLERFFTITACELFRVHHENVMLIAEMYMLCNGTPFHKHICFLHIQMLLIKGFIQDKYVLFKSWSYIFFSTLCSQSLQLFDQKCSKTVIFYVFYSCDGKAEFFSVIIPVFSVTWSRNHSNILIWCLSKNSNYNQCWKQLSLYRKFK